MKSTLLSLYPTVYPTENLDSLPVDNVTKKSDTKEPRTILEIVRRTANDRPVTTIYRGYQRVVVDEQVKRKPLRLTVARAWSELKNDSTVSTMTQYLQSSDEKTQVSSVDSTYVGQKVQKVQNDEKTSDDSFSPSDIDDSLSVYSLDSTYSGISSDDEIIQILKKKTQSDVNPLSLGEKVPVVPTTLSSEELDLTSNLLQYKNCTLKFSPCHRDEENSKENSTKKDIHYDSSDSSDESPDIFAMDEPAEQTEQSDLYDEHSNDINLDLQFARLAIYMDGCC